MISSHQWHLVEEDPTYTVAISPEAWHLYATSEQHIADAEREIRAQKDRMAIFCGTVAGSVVIGAIWVICKLLGV